ncbi:MAG: ribonuclease R [Lachnospiraceae bacterium]|nr:ribonuclease R [Lachnospiraceae bacterium]
MTKKKKEKKQYNGIFSATAKGFGFVTVEGFEEDFYIPKDYMGSALNGDEVTVMPLEKQGGKRTEAAIVDVLVRNTQTVVGTYEKSGNFGFLIPDDKKIGKDIFIPTEKDLHAMDGQKVVCYLTDYGDAHHNPEGIVVEILGYPSDPGVDITSVVRAYHLPTSFEPEVLKEAEKANVKVKRSDIRKRLDLRKEMMVTIDGDDSKDLDDAVSLIRDGEDYILGVHIADVSHYVKEKSELDFEARKRGNSVYLADRVIPMLPTTLSNDICSLNEDEDRLTLSCIMRIGPTGKVLDYRIAESVIHSTRRMTYSSVNRILEDADEEEIQKHKELVPMLKMMAELARILNKRRMKRGAIDFDFPETVIVLDEKGIPTDIHPYDRRTSNRLIEEFMLLANETVARFAFDHDLPFMYRVHGVPDGEKIRDLSRLLGSFGYTIKGDKNDITPKELQRLLKKIKGKPEEKLISTVVLRSMQQARYGTECEGHYGLAAEYYCHFTSPIRRYPDLMVHRILKEELKGKLKKKRIAYYDGILPQIATETSKTERRADETEREVDKLKKVQYISSYIGQEFSGVISGVTKWGIYVELPNTVEGMIAVSSIKGDYFTFDEEHYCLVGERTDRTFTLGQELRIIVEDADVMARTIDFSLAEDSYTKADKKRKSNKPLKKKEAIKEKDRKKEKEKKAAKKKTAAKRKQHGRRKSQAHRKQ